MNTELMNKISRLYDKPLLSSLTAVACIALSIFISLSMS